MSKEKDENVKNENYVIHYQKKINGAQSKPDRDSIILHCLNKLKLVPMNVNILTVTGIGKTVNMCRRFEGEVGRLAADVVDQWKSLVDKAERSSRGNSSECYASPPPPLDIVKKEEEPKNDVKPYHDDHNNRSSNREKESKSSRHNGNESKSKDRHHSSSKSSKESKSDKHHKDKSHRHSDSKSSSHNDEKSPKKRPHDEQDSKENEAKKIKLEEKLAVKKEQSSSNGHRHKKDKKKSEPKESREFDAAQGIGFAEALASFDKPSAKSSKIKKDHMADKMVKVKSIDNNLMKKPLKRLEKSPESHSSKHSKPSTSGESRKSIQSLTKPPKLLTEKPKLDILPEIAKELPNDVSIPEYRPLPLNSAMKDYISSVQGSNAGPCRFLKMSESEILAESFSSKANRTKVYSGTSKSRHVPRLFDLCIRYLQDHVDYLEFTGGVPYEILKPVLERARPETLQTIEYYNPQFLEDTDELWQPICQRKWSKKIPQEMETWREMYERCTSEDSEKLKQLTKTITKSHALQNISIQKTKMAFVDSLVKPPRGVRQKQEQFGTSSKLVASPAARTEGLRHLAPNLVAPGDVRLRVQAGLRDDAQSAGRSNLNRGIMPSKAPMMRKLLSKHKIRR